MKANIFSISELLVNFGTFFELLGEYEQLRFEDTILASSAFSQI